MMSGSHCEVKLQFRRRSLLYLSGDGFRSHASRVLPSARRNANIIHMRMTDVPAEVAWATQWKSKLAPWWSLPPACHEAARYKCTFAKINMVSSRPFRHFVHMESRGLRGILICRKWCGVSHVYLIPEDGLY